MSEFRIKSPTIPIPFERLLKIVAVVDDANAQTKPLLDYLTAQGYEVEVSDRYDRDVTKDAEVGAYIALVDGDQESFNRFPGFNYEVQGVFPERVDGQIKFHTYVVRESESQRNKGGDRG